MPDRFDDFPPDDFGDGGFGGFGEPDDEAWDEHQWEHFLRHSDRRVNRYLDLLFNFAAENPTPEREDEAAYEAWRARLAAYLAKNRWREEDRDLAFLFLEGRTENDDDLAALAEDDDLYEDDIMGALDFRDLPVYRQAHALNQDVLAWANSLPGSLKDSTLVQFCACLSQTGANVAKGHGIGTEHDTIGGNIACAKRGLREANLALGLLQELRGEPYLGEERYRSLYERVYELRNALGVYVQDLRARFDLGID
jgi:hypothetical protein